MSASGEHLVLWMLIPDQNPVPHQDVVNLVMMFLVWAVLCLSFRWFVRAKDIYQYWVVKG